MDTDSSGLNSPMSKYKAIEKISEDILRLMEDLYQSGFDTVHDSTLRDMKKAAELTGQYGMEYLSEMLFHLSREVETGRHRMKREVSAMAEIYTNINEYLYFCRQRAAYDCGQEYYG